ncbi:MAG: threonine--tRNA ligase [Patescibacteria group bacterium]
MTEHNSEIDKIRHSLSHVMTMAILDIYPDAKLGVGPCIDNGFYQDYELAEPINDNILPKLEKRIKKLLQQKIDFIKSESSIEDSLKFYKNDPYKTELTKELESKGNKKVNFYDSGSFHNLCDGPHVNNTSEIDPKAFKLTKIAGAYWRGDEKNKMLTRIYGVAFKTEAELKKHLELIAEAEKRDHRKLGKELKLFTMSEYGPGFPIFLNNGLIIWNELLKYWREVHIKYNYQEIKTPIMFNKALWETSGHWDYYRENMYTSEIDENIYVIKPMNCPGGMLAYKEDLHSYKEFPLKIGEIGQVHRHEKSGVLAGLFRVRTFHQDDAHIFVEEHQIQDQVLEILNIIDEMYSTFGLKYHLELSTRPVKSIGTDSAWELSTSMLEKALIKTKREFKINAGDGAFYGPKIDVHLEDALGRTWQCATIQVDMNLPERFDLTYIDKEGNKKRPVMMHRVIYGAVERFLGILIEHFAGNFPVWLSPVQVTIISVGEKHEEHCRQLAEEFKKNDLRVELDLTAETVGNKIRKAIKQKIPYLLVIGDKEMESADLMVRFRGEKEARKISKIEFIDQIKKNIINKSFDL